MSKSSSPVFENDADHLAIIGAGNMAQAIMFPLLKSGLITPSSVTVAAPSMNNLPAWKELGCNITNSSVEALSGATYVMWAVKPQVFPTVVSQIEKDASKLEIKNGVCHISLLAGVTIKHINSSLQTALKWDLSRQLSIVRVMPNIAVQVRQGVVVYATSSSSTQSHRDSIERMFRPLGLCYKVDEHLINAYCGLFGSGIGFMFPILEAMSDGAVQLGIPRKNSLEIAAQVMKGAGELVLMEKLHPAVLKDKVCSPGGTTICGVTSLEQSGVRNSMIKAIASSYSRAESLCPRE